MTELLEEKLKKLQKEVSLLKGYIRDDDENDTDIEKENEKMFLNDFSNCIIVDNFPCVNETKYEKLLKIIKKNFERFGTIIDIDMPYNVNNDNNDKMTAGVCFIEYESMDMANKAVLGADNLGFDKKHTLRVSKYTDLNRYIYETPEKYIEPNKPEYIEKPNYKNWLLDPYSRDMFTLRYAKETEIYYSDNINGNHSLVYAGEKEKRNGKTWCSQYVLWSPQGNYLATFHPQGIALWGGDKWEKVGRFAHKGLKQITFSPNDIYLVTYSDANPENAICIWDIASCKLIRSFPCHQNSNDNLFKWSYDDKYIARKGKDCISIYELPSMKLLDKKSLKTDNVIDFSWSPTDNIISYFSPENNNVPARVSLIEIPSRRDIRNKNLVNVTDCKLNWHINGNYLCFKVIRHSKSKKTLFTNLELFRIRENLVPVEMLEIKETVIAFSFEPKGSRFAVIHGDIQGNTNIKPNVSFYDMLGGQNNDKLVLLFTLTKISCNRLYWSPQGNNIILAGMGEMNGIIEFIDVNEQESLAEQEHYKCTNIDWDPSGRTVTTSVCQSIENSYYKYQIDNGYIIWSFQGKKIKEEKKDNFYQFLWRPRPKCLLTDKEYNDIKKNIKKYEKKYQDIDKKLEKDRYKKQKEMKNKLLHDFITLLKNRKDNYDNNMRKQIISLRDGNDSENDDEGYDIKTEVYDEIISHTEEIIRS